MGREPRDRTSASPLARRRAAAAAVLLPDRGDGDAHLADRGCPEAAPGDPQADRAVQRRSQPRAVSHRAQDGDRQRQDHGHGDADRLAGGQLRAAPQRQAVLRRVPDRHTRHHDQGSAARPPAKRPAELLRDAQSHPARHAGRRAQGARGHHQLSRVQAAREAPGAEAHQANPPGSRSSARAPPRPKAR